jgi:hypothetical protein
MRMRGQARTGAGRLTFFLKKILIFGERHLRRVLIVPVYSAGRFWCLVFDVCHRADYFRSKRRHAS